LVVVFLVTHWTEDFWYRNGDAPFTMNFDPKIIGLRRQRYRAVGLYWKGKLKEVYVDRTHLKPAFLFVNNIKQKDGGIIISYEYLGQNMEFTSQTLMERIRKLDKFGGRYPPLCFLLEDNEWEGIQRDLNIIQPKDWGELIEPPLHLLGDYFLRIETYDWRAYESAVANCFSILGFRVNRLGDLKRDEQARVPDGYIYSPPTTPRNTSFWVAYDCKAKHDFPSPEDKPADEERKMIEYLQNEEMRAHLMGVEPSNKYFLYVAHSFKPHATQMCNKIQSSTKAIGGLITTWNLRYLLEKRLRTGYKFVIENIPRLFANKEISASDIDRVFPREDEFES